MPNSSTSPNPNPAVPADKPGLASLLENLQNTDPDVRTRAWVGAADVGAEAVVPLGGLMATGETEVARAAKRGMWRIVRDAGNPKTPDRRQAVEAALIALLNSAPTVSVVREILWMLSEIGSEEAVAPVLVFIDRPDLREDARMSLERIPGDASLEALQTAFAKAPEDFKLNLAQSLRKRGETVEGYPCAKLVPTRETQVQPLK